MKKYKVRIKSAPKMNYGGFIPRFAEGADVPALTEQEAAMMRYGYDPVVGSLNGAVNLAPVEGSYPIGNMPGAAPYAGNSIYDYMTSKGQKADYASRKELAKSMGIKNYSGTAAQNQRMLEMMRGTGQSAAPVAPRAKAPMGVVTKAPNGQVQSAPAPPVGNDPEDYRAWDKDGNFRFADTHPRFNQIVGANYFPQYDARHQPWSPNLGIDEEDIQTMSRYNSYGKNAGKVNIPAGQRTLPGKRAAAVKAWNRQSIPGDQYKDGWEDTPAVYTPKNMFPKNATFPGSAKQTMEWRNTMIPGANYQDGWNTPTNPYMPQNMFPKHFAYGGQTGFGLNLNIKRSLTDMPEDRAEATRRTVAPVDPEEATYEAEQGEVIVGDFDKDGQNESGVFGGKRHSQGGTPAKEEGFIFSDTKGLRLRGPIVEEFGKTAGKRQYTPAELAKQYDLTKYKAVIDDPNADQYKKRTAELMLENYERKLGKLALVQESMKGFPQGVPEIAQKFMAAKEEQAPQPAAPQDMGEAAYGGYYMAGGGGKKNKPVERYPVFDKDYLAALNGLKDKVDVMLPVNATGDPNRFTLPAIQSQQGQSGIYGDENWFDDTHKADFMKRQSWYMDNAPNWNPSMPGATKAFQLAYDQEAVRRGLKPYFAGKKFQEADGKFGEYTFSAPGFGDRAQATTVPATTTPATTTTTTTTAGEPKKEITNEEYKLQEGEDPNYVSGRKRLPYNAMDVANLFQAVSSPVKSYAPRMFTPDIQEMQGYYDQANYNPMLANANTRMQMNNTFGSGTAAMAANTYNPEILQGIQSETQRVAANNLGTANQMSQYNNQLRNNASVMNNQLAQDNYDKWVKTQEETDIANKLKWRKDVTPAAQNMINNRINMERYNAMYPQYAVTGPMWDVTFQGGKNKDQAASAPTGTYTAAHFFKENPDLKELYEKGDVKEKLQIQAMIQARAREYRAMYTKNPKYLAANMANYQMNSMYPGATGPNPDFD